MYVIMIDALQLQMFLSTIHKYYLYRIYKTKC